MLVQVKVGAFKSFLLYSSCFHAAGPVIQHFQISLHQTNRCVREEMLTVTQYRSSKSNVVNHSVCVANIYHAMHPVCIMSRSKDTNLVQIKSFCSSACSMDTNNCPQTCSRKFILNMCRLSEQNRRRFCLGDKKKKNTSFCSS